jgi:hypothetical protein
MRGWTNIQKWFRNQVVLALGMAIIILTLVYLVWVALSPVILVAVWVGKF